MPFLKMPLSSRVYHCLCCLLSLDRDLNASKNIKAVELHNMSLSREAPAFAVGSSHNTILGTLSSS